MWFINLIVVLSILVVFCTVESTQAHYKEFTIEDPKICSPITKRKVKYEALVLNQGRSINTHSIPWNSANLCKFEVQSPYHKGGIIAVIQKLNLRRNNVTGECIDYITFKNKRGGTSHKYCGIIDARTIMAQKPHFEFANSYEHSFVDELPISFGNSFIDTDGELDVTIYIHKDPLSYSEKTELVVVFTSYKECSERLQQKHIPLKPCDSIIAELCINWHYFKDDYINCPYFECVDEDGCLQVADHDSKVSVGNKVVIGSVSTLVILFAIFTCLIWAFKKHKLLCWSENFSHPTATPESNRNSRTMEMNEQTGARLAQTPETNNQPSAPVEEEKDLPPSYESLFPGTRS